MTRRTLRFKSNTRGNGSIVLCLLSHKKANEINDSLRPVSFRPVVVDRFLLVFPRNVSEMLELESKNLCNGRSAISSAISSRSRRCISIILRGMKTAAGPTEYER